jgi:carbamoylphosphate synthase small subunit
LIGCITESDFKIGMVCGKEEDGVDVVMDGNGETNNVAHHEAPLPQVLILDYGSQYSKLIDRKVRELNVHSEIVPLTTTIEEITKSGAK